VVPCFNEVDRLRPDDFVAAVEREPGLSFLFVDDGSTDGTAGALRTLCARRPDRLELIELARNRGKAEAVRQGLLAAIDRDADYAGYWDADLSTPLAAIPEFRAVLDARPGVRLVMGARVQLLGRHISRRATRHYSGRIFATLASLTLGLPVYDTQCGAKLFRVTPDLGAVFDTPFLSRWIFDVEILERMLRPAGGRSAVAAAGIVELPLLEWTDVGGSKVRPTDFARAGLELARIRFSRRARRAAGESIRSAFVARAAAPPA
jgi:glycosyltransferase involved in cell wall biosynthesis